MFPLSISSSYATSICSPRPIAGLMEGEGRICLLLMFLLATPHGFSPPRPLAGRGPTFKGRGGENCLLLIFLLAVPHRLASIETKKLAESHVTTGIKFSSSVNLIAATQY